MGETTLLGRFDYVSQEDKNQAINSQKWFPDTGDWERGARRVLGRSAEIIETSSVARFLGGILINAAKKPRLRGTLKRVNLLTHANAKYIALLGTISVVSDPKAVLPLRVTVEFTQEGSADNTSYDPNAITERTLSTLRNAPYFNVPGLSRRVSLDDIRAVFTKDAVLALYACNTGLERAGGPIALGFLQEIADTFQCKVIGFKGLIECCFSSRNDFERGVFRYAVGDCKNGVADFRNLDTSKEAISVQPSKPLKPEEIIQNIIPLIFPPRF